MRETVTRLPVWPDLLLRLPSVVPPLSLRAKRSNLSTPGGFVGLFHDIIVTAKLSTDITGPVGIAILTGQVAQFGAIAVLQFMAILSVSLAVVNFLPLPALDGGRVAFLVIGKIIGRKVDHRIENMVHAVGFYLLILLIVLVTVRDFNRYSIIEKIRSLLR